MAKRKTEKPFDREKYERERDAMHEATRAKHARAIEVIRQLINREDLLVWVELPAELAGGKPLNLLLNAIEVDVNGRCVQIRTEKA